ncbi:MAG: hypothetical protein AAFU85_27985, partial [Planctomycetota bacterium]
MHSLPATLVDSLPAELVGDAKAWCETLDESDRDELQQLCDARKNLFLFETFSGSETKPEITGGTFIPGANAFGV